MLPNSYKAVIPINKLIDYSLNMEREPNKARAFQLALGYTNKSANKLIVNIYENLHNVIEIYKGNNGYGDIYETVMELIGENGKTANVMASWIIENGFDFPRLTNLYVTKKKPAR